MLFGGNQTDGNSFERFLTPYQNSRLPLKSFTCILSCSILQSCCHGAVEPWDQRLVPARGLWRRQDGVHLQPPFPHLRLRRLHQGVHGAPLWHAANRASRGVGSSAQPTQDGEWDDVDGSWMLCVGASILLVCRATQDSTKFCPI